ncbi:hypothetical protein AZE42_12305 [Rhizopogon vesiculosus]|uniref:Major facilitator superfamily (MFS) profile domain-containing protein n=1 Tax=Rhizopogon vesiculosus TaxID=180088 RepID=A0A1J8QFQ8_9AGAM|nr:hypothetical protein AZE42_12305 [Rhizopogon vesiculosus]
MSAVAPAYVSECSPQDIRGRILASKGYIAEGIANLAYLRMEPCDSTEVLLEFAEIEAAVWEEMESRKGLGLKEAFFGKGNFVRFAIAFMIFLLQQRSGQNSIGYYAPQIFTSFGYSGTTNSLLAFGINGIVKVVSTEFFVFFLVETLGRGMSLFISAVGMGVTFFTIGALLKTHPAISIRKYGRIDLSNQSRTF